MNSNERQREYRARNGNYCTIKYEKTKPGKLMRMYRNMLSRVTGIQKQKAHLYAGLSILDRQDFYKWASTQLEFHRLFDAWVASNYDRKRVPTVDRIDSKLGYELGNMEFVTHSENSRRGNVSRFAQASKRYPGKDWSHLK